MFKKKELVIFFRDRLAMLLMAGFFLSVLALITMTFFSVHISDVQLPNRYSDYGFTNLYRGKWYSLTLFALFGLVIFSINGYLSVKLREERRALSLSILSVSLVIMTFTIVIAAKVFGLAAFSL
ncbi:MAG: hypothetical protein PVI21_04410 [Candidatus Woesebacteria bacterium]|jgi:hypothetical protein